MFDDFLDDEELIDADEEYVSSEGPSLPPPRENPDLFAHENIEKQILDLFNKRQLPHAMIFAGPMGVGKMTMAFRVARFLLSQKDEEDGGLFGMEEPLPAPTTMQMSPDHPVFSKVAASAHPDLRTIERAMDERKGKQKSSVDVDSIRTIAPFLRMKATEGGWRVVIVDEADTMNRNAQNAILKILEEPPPKTVLIVICNRLGAMLPTIRSRCRTFHFPILDSASLTTLIKRAAPATNDSSLSLLATLSDGSAGKAIALLEEEGVNTLNTLLDFMGDWPQWRWVQIHTMADTLSRPDSDKAYLNFTFLAQWIAQGCAKARAIGPHVLPQILKLPAIERLIAHYSLDEWLEICEKLKEHFITIEHSNLDRRQGVIGTFSILGGQKA